MLPSHLRNTVRCTLGALALSAAGALAAHAAPASVVLLNDTGTTGVNLTFTNGHGGNDTVSNVAAGDYHISLGGGPSQTAFCTDLWDTITVGESWDVTPVQTSAANGLITAGSYYPVAPHNISAIDFIGQNYAASGISDSQSAAAQLAVWDLVVGGGLTVTAPNTYQWSSQFSETGVSQSSVYGIEQAALAASGPQGSSWLQTIDGSQTGTDGRPQDFVVSVPSQTPHGAPGPSAVPEPSSLTAMSLGLLGLGALMLRAKRKSLA